MKVSVIIPAYNVGPYLRECLDSICNQTLTDLEIFCINDGSTDDTSAILKEYAVKDRRIQVIDQENQGQSIARNRGLELASGAFVYFMDADDILEQEALENLTHRAEETDAELVVFGLVPFCRSDSEQTIAECDHFRSYYQRKEDYPEVYTGVGLANAMRDNGDYKPAPTGFLVRRSLLERENLRFIPHIIHEDNAYTFSLFLYARRAVYDKHAYFHRRVRDNSIMTIKKAFRNVYGYFSSVMEMSRRLACADLMQEERDGLQRIVQGALSNARSIFMDLSPEEQNQWMLLPEQEKGVFQLLVKWGAEESAKAKSRERAARQTESELSAKLQQTHKEKSELNAKLQQTHKEKSELNAKLQQSYAEKSALNARLQQTYKEKSELNARLQQSYGEKSELNAKLQQTYKEKSELNAKLQQTYKEKSQRGETIQKQKQELEALEKECDQLREQCREQEEQLKRLNQLACVRMAKKLNKNL